MFRVRTGVVWLSGVSTTRVEGPAAGCGEKGLPLEQGALKCPQEISHEWWHSLV